MHSTLYVCDQLIIRSGDEAETTHLRSLPSASNRLRLFQIDLLDPDSILAAIRGDSGVFHHALPCIITHVQDPQRLNADGGYSESPGRIDLGAWRRETRRVSGFSSASITTEQQLLLPAATRLLLLAISSSGDALVTSSSGDAPSPARDFFQRRLGHNGGVFFFFLLHLATLPNLFISCSDSFTAGYSTSFVDLCFLPRHRHLISCAVPAAVPLLISLCGASGYFSKLETSGISANPMASSGQVQPFFTMASTGGPGLQIVSEKLSETNYASWAVAIELYVEGHDKLDILHSSKVKPDEKDPSFRTWRRDNIQLMTWILNSLSSQIFKLEQGSMSVTNYFATLKGLWDEFDYYRMENWSSTDDHQRYLKLLEKDRIIKFLDGLNAEFENLKGQILGLDPTPSLEQVYYKILSEEGRRRTMNNKGISTISPPVGETSVFIGSANKFRPGGTKGRGDRFCRHCKRTNHDSDFCWEKYPEKKPENFKHNAKKAPNSGDIAIQKLENEEIIGSFVPSTTGLSSTDIVNLQHLLSRLQASSSVSTPVQAHTGIHSLGLSVTGPSFYSPWVIDSGATDHMANAANSFISYSLSSGQEKVIIADGTKATIAGKALLNNYTAP
ncbi:hypothetical protein ZIOFF_004619 [Zingiber officinale]|uniref:Retrotransposon Copia-like N-terminal domain-containing protein n=1 Tax=Zingiber officinale TaxID=94328 RepID=A0A8J5HQ61_ZINOF|nr:hypothetical protein ZIOFF_004619 [Zingiber officinale]